MPKLRNKGSQASRQTIIGTLARYTKEGKLKRIAPNIYVVKMLRPPEPQAAHPAQESNGLKLAKQLIQPGTLKYDCYTALKERGQFMTAGEVHKVLSQRGKTFNAQNPVDHVASAMRDSIREGENEEKCFSIFRAKGHRFDFSNVVVRFDLLPHKPNWGILIPQSAVEITLLCRRFDGLSHDRTKHEDIEWPFRSVHDAPHLWLSQRAPLQSSRIDHLHRAYLQPSSSSDDIATRIS
jgi:hypothetical protein